MIRNGLLHVCFIFLECKANNAQYVTLVVRQPSFNNQHPCSGG